MPNEDIIYFGDTARVPYGGKSYETIRRYSLEIANFLIRKNVKLIVIACNTASSVALPVLRKKYKIPFVGVIRPAANSAYVSSANHRIGVIGTIGTVKSGAYKKELEKLNPNIKVFQTACPLFVPLAEEGWHKSNIAQLASVKYLSSLKRKNIDTIILGCTHYPLLKSVIGRTFGKGVRMIDAGKETASEVKRILSEKKINNTGKKKGIMMAWFQPGSSNDEVVKYAESLGIEVVHSVCLMVSI